MRLIFSDGNVGCNVHYGQGDTPTTSLVWGIWNITYMRLINFNLRQKRDLNSVTAETSCLRIKMHSINSLDRLEQRTRTGSQTGNTGMGKIRRRWDKKKKVKGLFINSAQYNKHGHNQGLQIIQSGCFKMQT